MKRMNLIKVCAAVAALALAFPGCNNLNEVSAQNEAAVVDGKVAVSVSVDYASRTIVSDTSGKSYAYTLVVTNTADSADSQTVNLSDIATAQTVTVNADATYSFVLTAYDGENAVLSGSATKTITASDNAVSITLAAVTGEAVNVTLALTIDGAESYGVSDVAVTVYTDSACATASEAEADALSAAKGEDDAWSVTGTVASGVSKWLRIALLDSSGAEIGGKTECVYAVNSAPISATVAVPVTKYKATIAVTTEDASAPTVTLKNADVTDAEDITLTTSSESSPYTYTGYVPKCSYGVYVGETKYDEVSNANPVEVDTSLTLKSISAAWTSGEEPAFYTESVTDEAIIAALTVTATYTDSTGAECSKTVSSGITLSYDQTSTSAQTLTVTYMEKTATVSLTLAGLSALGVSPQAVTIAYGESVSTDDLTVTATYTNSDTQTKSATDYTLAYYSDQACTASIADISVATHGTYYAKISYSSVSAELTVTVTTEAQSLALSTSSIIGVSSLSSITGTVTYTDGTTADVANNTLSFKNGDAAITAQSSLDAGAYTITATYAESGNADGSVLAGSVNATASLVVQAELGYSIGGSLAKDKTIPPVAVTENTGASVSFWLDLASAVTDATFEWESPLKITDGSNTIWIDVGPLGIWLTDGGANIFEGSATRGADYTADNWTLFCQDGNAQYVTINFGTDGNITYYKNGLAALTYTASTVVTDDITVATGCAKAIELLATNGAVLAPTLEGTEYAMYDAYVTSALDADAAKERFLAAFSAIAIDTSSVTTSFAKNDTFSSSEISATGTDSQNATFDLSSYVTVDSSAVDMTTAGEYTVTVTCGSESATYTVKVNDISLSKIALTTTDVQTQYYTDGTHVPVLSTDNLVITATYSDESTATIDVSNADVSSLTATTGTQTVTVTYGGQSATYDVTVSSLTESAASWSGDITGGAWWTVFAGSSSYDGIKVAAGTKLTTTMTITACATGSSSYNWEFAPDVILFHSTSGTEYGVLRADHYGWGDAIGEACANITATSDWDWAAFQTYVPDSTVTISVYNFGDGIAEVHYDFTKTVDETTTTHYQYYSEIPVTVDELYANLVFENCNATFATE